MRIALYGDSLTEGWPGTAFVPLLAQALPRDTLVNRGRAGDTTVDLLARLRREGVDEADVAVVWIGTNDAFTATAGGWTAADDDWLLAGEPAPEWASVLGAIAEAYEILLDTVTPAAARLLLVPPVAPDGDLGEPFTTRIDELAALVRAVAAARPHARLVDLRPAFAAAAGPFTIDGVHLNERGAAVVAEALAAVVAGEEAPTAR